MLRVIDFQNGERCGAGDSTISWQSKGLHFLGAWSATTQYAVNDLVTDTGGAFIRIKVATNVGRRTNDPTFWAALAPALTSVCSGYPHVGIDWSKPGSSPGNGCNFTGANFTSANFNSGNLSNANLTVANFTTASLLGANLSGANLSSADFSHASLANAILNGANLTGTHLAAADVAGDDLTNANLTGANFGFASGTDSLVYSNTTCPDGSNSDANGGTCAGFGGGL